MATSVCGEEGIVQNKNQEHFFKSAEKIAVKWWRYFEAHTHQRYCDSIFKQVLYLCSKMSTQIVLALEPFYLNFIKLLQQLKGLGPRNLRNHLGTNGFLGKIASNTLWGNCPWSWAWQFVGKRNFFFLKASLSYHRSFFILFSGLIVIN